MGVGKQLKLFHVLQTQSTNLTDEQREEYEKNATGLTKLMATMVTATAYGKMQNKMVSLKFYFMHMVPTNIAFLHLLMLQDFVLLIGEFLLL